jgi:hypothetical protein
MGALAVKAKRKKERARRAEPEDRVSPSPALLGPFVTAHQNAE